MDARCGLLPHIINQWYADKYSASRSILSEA